MPSAQPSPGIELFDLIGGTKQQFRAAAFDLSGSLIWFYDYPITDGYPSPVKQLSNGDMMFVLSEGAEVIREVDLIGQTVRELKIADLNANLASAGFNIVASKIHHEIIELPNGRLGFLVNEVRQINVNGYTGNIPVLGDAVVVVDSAFNVLWAWSLFDHLDVNRHPFFPYQYVPAYGMTYDWTHSNSLAYSPSDKSLVLSIRHQSWIIKIDYGDGAGSGNILWKLGSGGDFQLLGGNAPMDWFYLEHYAELLTDTANAFDLMMFDNGDFRPIDDTGTQCGTAANPCYSRPVILHVDETARTVTLVWAPHYWYSGWGGTFQQLAADRYEFTFSSMPGNNGGSRVIETTGGSSPQIIWQADTTQPCYRAVRLTSLYPGTAHP